MERKRSQPQGTAPEMQGRIFERFFRGHPNAAEGTGLGLAIVKEAVQQLDSELRFDSVPGQGATFRFRLPRQEQAEEPTQEADV